MTAYVGQVMYSITPLPEDAFSLQVVCNSALGGHLLLRTLSTALGMGACCGSQQHLLMLCSTLHDCSLLLHLCLRLASTLQGILQQSWGALLWFGGACAVCFHSTVPNRGQHCTAEDAVIFKELS